MANIDRKIKRNKKKQKETDEILVEDSNFCDALLMDRFKAFLTDSFMVMMPLMYFVSYVVIGSLSQFSQNKLLGWGYILIPHFIITISFWYYKSQTPGLKAYELSLIDCNTGDRPSIFALVNRYLFTTLSLILILPLFVPYLNKKRKTLQDIVSNTCIKNTPNEN